MNIRKRRSDRSGRAPLSSPGRPPVAGRDERRRFWAAIAAGMASEDAAVGAGVPQAVGTRWFRKAGGMPPAMFGLSAKPLSGRYLSFAEREEIALLRAQGYSMQEVARRLGRAVSTISRELRRNAATRSGGLEYRATTAQWHAERAARRPKQAKLALNAALRVTLPPISGPGRSSLMRPEPLSCPSLPVPVSGSRCSSGAVGGCRRSRYTRTAQPWPRAWCETGYGARARF
jgi:transposase-like protein